MKILYKEEIEMIGIVGCGHVGSAMKKLFENAKVYDKYLSIGTHDDINNCDVAFVCVPTPMGEYGECDTSYVDEVLEWVLADVVVIRSTVPVGYTEKKCQELNKKIIFQPEYYGETPNHPLADLKKRNWIVLGGNRKYMAKVIEAYKTVYTADIHIMKVDSNVAELAKYMENAYLATKVTFCNEFYDIANAYNVDYDVLREVWLMDPRINSSHTFVYENDRGYAGSCFPKDMNAISYIAKQKGINCDLLDGVIAKNEKLRKLKHEL